MRQDKSVAEAKAKARDKEFIGDFDSKEEVYFSWWVKEMVEAGYIIEAIYHPEKIEMCPPVTMKYYKKLKTKTKTEMKNLLQPFTYTADWKILFTADFFERGTTTLVDKIWGSKDIPIALSYDGYWYVDVKGSNSQFKDTKFFSVVQKVLYCNNKIYAQKVIVSTKDNSFFKKTFTPERFLCTDGQTKKRALSYEARGLKEWITSSQLDHNQTDCLEDL